MPPKPKFTKDEVVNAALGIVRAQGEAALTARALAEALGSSARPIFTLFSGMEEVKEALYEPAFDAFYRYCDGFKDFIPRFKKLGVTLVSFATSEPHLFEFLFIGRRSQTRTLDEWCSSRIADEAIRVVEEDYGLDHEVAVALDGGGVAVERGELFCRRGVEKTHHIDEELDVDEICRGVVF